ncbi:MAG TPA: hypothetical protein VNE18_04000, partial [Rhodanobacter sp.]|nr:hypothetical protein [Rhodanobacter sp.]
MPIQRIFNSSELLLSSLVAAGETARLALWLPLLAGMVGRETVAPPAAGLFVIGLASYWWARLGQTGRFGNQADLFTLGSCSVLVAGWLVTTVGVPLQVADLRYGWMAVLLGGIAWLRGSSLASATDLAAPERAHRLLGQGVLLIGAALMLSFAWHSPASAAARQAAWWAIPVLLLSALMLSAYGVANAVIGSSSESTSHQ